MRNIHLVIEYEGSKYLGWQRQPQGMTVQQALEDALEKITGAATNVTGASRTDTGVHARGQSANFRTDSTLTPERMRGALNAILPRDIVVIRAHEAPEDFDSRIGALSKLYHYTIWNHPRRPALERRYVWHVRWRLNLDLMQEASNHLLGRHDFAAFQSANAQSATTVRTITHASWNRWGPRVLFAIEGDGFLYNMVRAIVGTLGEVGREKITPGYFRQIIESADRRMAGRTAPAQGLCLMSVRYPGGTFPIPEPKEGEAPDY